MHRMLCRIITETPPYVPPFGDQLDTAYRLYLEASRTRELVHALQSALLHDPVLGPRLRELARRAFARDRRRYDAYNVLVEQRFADLGRQQRAAVDAATLTEIGELAA